MAAFNHLLPGINVARQCHLTMKANTAQARASMLAQARQFAAQNIGIDDNWRIRRSDALNWEVQYQGKFRGYYGSLVAAMKSLPSQMLDVEACNSVVQIIEAQRAIHSRIESTLKLKLA